MCDRALQCAMRGQAGLVTPPSNLPPPPPPPTIHSTTPHPAPTSQINVKVVVRNLESKAPPGTWPECCALVHREGVPPTLSLHFSPEAPRRIGAYFEVGFYVPPGTHVVTSETRSGLPAAACCCLPHC